MTDMMCRMIALVAVVMLVVVPVATAYSIPHDHESAAAHGDDHRDKAEADCEGPDCSDQNRRADEEDGRCDTTTGHCSSSMFRPDMSYAITIDWSFNIVVPNSDKLFSGLNPESETPPPRT